MKLLTRFQRREKRATIVGKEDKEITPEKEWRYYVSLDEKVLSKRPVNMKDYMKGIFIGLIVSGLFWLLLYVLWILSK